MVNLPVSEWLPDGEEERKVGDKRRASGSEPASMKVVDADARRTDDGGRA